MNRTAFAISIALTAFVLLLIGGIAYTVHAANVRAANAAQEATTAAPTAPADTAAQQDLAQAFSQREAQYQQLIAEANARLEESQKQQQALQEQLAALQAANPAAPAATTQTAAITPEQAASIASQAFGQTSVYSVEATSLQGQDVYKVTFSSGDIAYVDAQGQVVGSVSAQQAANQRRTTTGEHEHEEFEHEDDD